jgi:hypothetical protein
MSQPVSRAFDPSPGIKFSSNPIYEAKATGEKGERDCQLAMQVLQVARDMNPPVHGGERVTAVALTEYAETLWKWVTE